MPVSSSPFVDIMAKEVSDHMIQRGWWPDCTAEKILYLADSYEELQRWRKDVYAYNSTDGCIALSEFPLKPRNGQVVWVEHEGTAYRYLFKDKEWMYIEARTMDNF